MLQPEFFVEISEELAKEKGIKNGGWVRVWSKRGSVKAKAVVTKRIKPLICDGKTVHIVGIPLHWGFIGAARKGFGPNTLTPFVGDANIETPEYKAFLVDIEPIAGPRWRLKGGGRACTSSSHPDPARRNPTTRLRRGSAMAWTSDPSRVGADDRSVKRSRLAGAADRPGRQADRRLEVHRLQGLPGRPASSGTT